MHTHKRKGLTSLTFPSEGNTYNNKNEHKTEQYQITRYLYIYICYADEHQVQQEQEKMVK